MKLSLFDAATGEYERETEIPDEVVKAALLVHDWLSEQPPYSQLCGLTIVRDE